MDQHIAWLLSRANNTDLGFCLFVFDTLSLVKVRSLHSGSLLVGCVSYRVRQMCDALCSPCDQRVESICTLPPSPATLIFLAPIILSLQNNCMHLFRLAVCIQGSPWLFRGFPFLLAHDSCSCSYTSLSHLPLKGVMAAFSLGEFGSSPCKHLHTSYFSVHLGKYQGA